MTVSKAEARTAVEKLLQAVWADSGVSTRLARFLLSTHGAHKQVDFGLFPHLDDSNLAAAETAMRYSLFQRKYELPLSWDEAQELVRFWKERSDDAA